MTILEIIKSIFVIRKETGWSYGEILSMPNYAKLDLYLDILENERRNVDE